MFANRNMEYCHLRNLQNVPSFVQHFASMKTEFDCTLGRTMKSTNCYNLGGLPLIPSLWNKQNMKRFFFHKQVMYTWWDVNNKGCQNWPFFLKGTRSSYRKGGTLPSQGGYHGCSFEDRYVRKYLFRVHYGILWAWCQTCNCAPPSGYKFVFSDYNMHFSVCNVHYRLHWSTEFV